MSPGWIEASLPITSLAEKHPAHLALEDPNDHSKCAAAKEERRLALEDPNNAATACGSKKEGMGTYQEAR